MQMRYCIIEQMLIVMIIFFASSCSQTLKVKAKQTQHYTIYEDIDLSQTGSWVATDIQIPSKAIVAILAQGNLKYIPEGWYADPPSCLRLMVGKNGREIVLRSGKDSKNPTSVNVVKNSRDGFLYYSVGRNYPDPSLFRSFLKATIIVWIEEKEAHINEDIAILKILRPDLERQLGIIPLLLPECYYLSGDYEKARLLLTPLRQRYGKNPWVFMMSSANESQLGNADKANAYAQLAVDAWIKSGNKCNHGAGQHHLPV